MKTSGSVSRREVFATAGAVVLSLGVGGTLFGRGREPDEEKMPEGIKVEKGNEPTLEQLQKAEKCADEAPMKAPKIAGQSRQKTEGLVTLRGNSLYYEAGE